MSIYQLSLNDQGVDSSDESVKKEFIHQLLELPHKILLHHDIGELAPLILHELGHNSAFGFSKAGYLVNNPDFNCVRGLAGYCEQECKHHHDNIWLNPHHFSESMQHASFHEHVKGFYDKGIDIGSDGEINEGVLFELSKVLGIDNISFLTWKMRHGNHGILLYDGVENSLSHRREFLHHFVPLLSLS